MTRADLILGDLPMPLVAYYDGSDDDPYAWLVGEIEGVVQP